jgi:predicted ATPase
LGQRLACAGGAASEEIFWAARKLLETVAGSRPVVVVFDDVHWAEPTFLDLIDHLAVWLRGARVLLLCTARPELLEARPGWVDKPHAAHVVLEPLSHAESEELIVNATADAPLGAELRARIAAAAEGNPLYVEEMLAMLADRAGGSDDAEVAVPPTIQALLAARLDQLDSSEREVVGRAAVIGQEFSRASVLATVAARPRAGG